MYCNLWQNFMYRGFNTHFWNLQWWQHLKKIEETIKKLQVEKFNLRLILSKGDFYLIYLAVNELQWFLKNICAHFLAPGSGSILQQFWDICSQINFPRNVQIRFNNSPSMFLQLPAAMLYTLISAYSTDVALFRLPAFFEPSVFPGGKSSWI